MTVLPEGTLFSRSKGRIVPKRAAGYRSHPETQLQIAIVVFCRPRLLPGARLLGINGELPGGRDMQRQAAKRKAMGYTRGTPDLLAIGPLGFGFIEVKVPPNKQTEEQLDFESWVKAMRTDMANMDYAVVTSVEDAYHLLIAWGCA